MTQEFVTLQREVVERALKVLEYAANDVLTGRNAATELRAALEQPDHSEQSYMGCVTSDMHELAEWLNTMYEDSKEQIAALEQPQGEQEICCKNWSVNRIDDLGKIVDSSGRLIATVYGLQAEKIVACHNSHAKQKPQNEQEPVAWCELDADRRGIAYFDGKPIIMTGPSGNEHHPDPLYTRPHPKRQPLTHQQIDAIAESMPGGLDGFLKGWGWRQFARAIEAAHNIK